MSSLPTRQLGKGGPEVVALGLGLMGLSAFYGAPKSDEACFALLDAAYEAGETNWDTADVYMSNEDVIGRYFKARPGRREKIFLATKFANLNLPDGTRVVNSSPEYIKQAIEKSLTRLGLPSVDLYYCHRLDGKTPIELTVKAMAELKQEGKIKYLGLSECSSESLRRAHAVHPISAVQIEYSPFTLDIESEQIGLLKTCRELGVATVAYSPIGRGMLSGQIKTLDDLEEGDFRRKMPRFSPENFPKNLELVDKITAIAKKKGVTPSQLTLAWLMAQGNDVIPIPGTTRPERLRENLDALNVKLSADEEKEIREASERAVPAGDRYMEGIMQYCFADTPPLKA